MRYQTTEYHCGPAALQNALKTLRTHVSQDRIADLAGTTEADGTDEYGIIRAAVALGFGVDEFSTAEPAKAFCQLYGALLVGRPVVFPVDRWSHWVTAIGLVGRSIIVAEPARLPYAVKENGVLVVDRGRLLRRWRAARRVAKGSPAYYGLAIGMPV